MADDKRKHEGVIYQVGEPERVGRYPVRTELTVLPAADDPKVGWTVGHVYSGEEVFKAGAPDVSLTRREDLQEGMEIIVATLVGGYRMIVKRDDDGELYAETANGLTGAFLDFDTDDRHCWTSAMAYNRRALKSLETSG